MNSYPRETIEFIPITVTRDGQTYTTFDTAITPRTGRPQTWEPALTLEGTPGVLISGLPPGIHKLWARINDTPEQPVIEVGSINIT